MLRLLFQFLLLFLSLPLNEFMLASCRGWYRGFFMLMSDEVVVAVVADFADFVVIAIVVVIVSVVSLPSLFLFLIYI